jgi:hypothetical protein
MTEGTNLYKKLIIKKYVSYLFVTVSIMFVLNRFYVRPFVLENDFPDIFPIVVLSLPNFCEAVMGTLLLTGILLQMRQILGDKLKPFKTTYVFSTALMLASIYVISQEFKLHNIGGNNVYDPYDLVASIIGLTLTYMIIRKFGFLEIMEAEIAEKIE